MAHTERIPKFQQNRRIVSGTAELRSAVIDVVSRAQRTLAILTPNLEPDIYEHDEFLEVLKRFVLAKSFARVRVLISEPERAIKPGNQFVQVGQRLNSYIEFRNLAQAFRPEIRAYCIADAEAVIYRADYRTGQGMVALQAPDIARLYLSEFDDIWQPA